MPDMLRLQQPEPGVCRIEIAHPPLNLLTQQVRRELGDAFIGLGQNSDVRAVVFGSASAPFCAGADLKEFPLRFDPAVARAHGENGHRMIFALASLRKPVIAMISGVCMGGGLELAMACGVRLAASGARLALPENKRGVWPGTGGIFLLERLVGPAQARRLLLTGKTVSSEEALDLGLVDQVVPQEELEAAAMSLAAEFANNPPTSIESISDLLDRRHVAAFAEHLKYELELFVNAYQLPAAREGNLAFFEKRPPRW